MPVLTLQKYKNQLENNLKGKRKLKLFILLRTILNPTRPKKEINFVLPQLQGT